jgi:hypothetical protein
MDDQFTTREQVNAKVISILSELRVEQGLDVVHLDDASPIFSAGMERGPQQSADILLQLESEFGINISDDPGILDTLGTIGQLTDYIFERMRQKYER